jgi:bifunctional non-homologous end joining protein LigD
MVAHSTSQGVTGFVTPALATLVESVPVGDEWLHELKYDGYRIEAVVRGGRCALYSRNARDWTPRLPGIAARCAALGRDLVLDGELIATSRSAPAGFQHLQARLDRPVVRGVQYVVFDLLAVAGRSIRRAPLEVRREGLRQVLAGQRGPVRLSRELRGDPTSLLDRACRGGFEGVISKRRDAPYRSGRSMLWQKIKCVARQEFVIVGSTPPSGARQGFGSLLLAVRERGAWRYAGRVGSGFDTAGLAKLTSRLERLARQSSPLAIEPADLPRGTRWVRPELVAEVRFTEWTRDGRLRHPVFVALRSDKPATAIRRERPRSNQ